MSDSDGLSLKKIFTKAVKWGLMALVFGLAVEMLWTFPIVHNTIIGQQITTWASDFIVPFVDGIAEALGILNPTDVIAEPLSNVSGLGSGTEAMSIPNGAGVEGQLIDKTTGLPIEPGSEPFSGAPATETPLNETIPEQQYDYSDDLQFDDELSMGHEPVGKIGPDMGMHNNYSMAA